MLFHVRGRLQEAVSTYLDLLQRQESPHFKCVVAGLHGYLTRHNLAVVYEDLGDYARAEEQWRLVVKERPVHRLGWRGLGVALLRQGKGEEARNLAGRLIGDSRLRAEGLLLRGRVSAARRDLPAAMADWRRVATDYPNDRDLLEAVSRLAFEEAGPAAAETALVALVGCDPENSAAYHNLGTVYLQTRRPDRAVDAYRAALRHRPDNAPSWVNLGHALLASGQHNEAAHAWREALRHNPGDTDAAAALRELAVPGAR
jgi:tetratricopeptide (TPR) repeat protein